MSIQIAVTGIGVFCPLGRTVDELHAGLLRRKNAISPIQLFDASSLKVRHAAEIPHYDPMDYFEEHRAKKYDRTAQFGIIAARQAVQDAGLTQEQIQDSRTGLVVGICAGGQGDPPTPEQNPFEIRLDNFPETAIFVQADAIVSELGIHGPQNVISTACASSGSALGVALEWLRSGRCDRVLVGGTDAFSIPTYAGFYALGAMAPEPMSPFSEGIGVTFGEGAGFVVLESVDRAKERNATIYGELMGCGMTGDAHHVTSPHPGGEGLNRAMRLALKRAQLTPMDVNYFNAHGTGTRDNDTAETQAIGQLYGTKEEVPPISSSKSYFGHTLGAAGILEFIVSLIASREGFIPPTINYTAPRQGCELDYVPNESRDGDVAVFVSNSAAFGGVNASVVGGKLRPEIAKQESELDEIWITGTGVVSPIGCGNEEFWKSLEEGTSGIREVERFDVAGLRTRHAALVPEFNARKLIPSVDTRRAETMNRYAMIAAGLAIQSSGQQPRSIDSTRTGLIMALTYGSVTVQENFRTSLLQDGIENLSAKYFPSMVVSTIGGQVSQSFKLQGINNTVVAGITSGLTALAHGYELLRQNSDQDSLVVVGADEVGSLMFKVFSDRGITAEYGPNEFALNLYGKGTGSVLGEGGGALMLERATFARNRNAKPLAKVAGFGANNDATSLGTIELEGEWLSRAIQDALKEAGKEVGEIDWILTHGRGIPEYDQREVKAIRRVFGDGCPPVSCIAGHVGVGGASMSMFSLIAAVQGMQRGLAFATLSSAIGSSDLPLVVEQARAGEYRTVLILGSTEHGSNTAIILERIES